MFRVSLRRAHMVFILLPALCCAFTARAAEPSRLDGSWTPDIAALLTERHPEMAPEAKALVMEQVKERVGGLVIDTKAGFITVKRKTGDTRVTITSLETTAEDTLRMGTRDEKTGATGILIWKILSDKRIGMSRPDGPMAVYNRE